MWLSRLIIKWWRSFQSGRALIFDSESLLDNFPEKFDIETEPLIDAVGDWRPSWLKPSVECIRKRPPALSAPLGLPPPGIELHSPQDPRPTESQQASALAAVNVP